MWSVLHSEMNMFHIITWLQRLGSNERLMIIEFIFQPISRFNEVHFGRFTNYILNGTFFLIFYRKDRAVEVNK